MHITSNLILRQHLAPLLRQERLNRGLTPSQVAICCDLSADTIERIENGLGVSIRKYIHLLHYYDKNMKIELVDR
ncbi:MAG: helix-turn-helix domain-containing protein [Alphaproteobacteria bacterium]|nr:helix-turn-helix domain-containing protein [Alphaproteobacteria bacterium]